MSAEVGRSPAEVALAWTMARFGVGTLLTGASAIEQLERNFSALEIILTEEKSGALDQASAPPSTFPWSGFNSDVRRQVFGGNDVKGWKS